MWATAIAAALQASKSGAPAGPSSNYSPTSSMFDSSGWTVSTGNSKASGAGASTVPWTLLAVAAVVVALIWKRK